MSDTGGLPCWVACLRIARRDAWRAKGRSLLVIALIAVPILVSTAADIAWRTWQLSPADEVTRWLGNADVAVQKLGEQVQQTPDAWYGDGVAATWTGRRWQPGTSQTALAAVPGATRVVAERVATGRWLFQTPNGLQRTDVAQFAYRDPLVAGRYVQLAGRAPRRQGEVALTEHLAELVGAHVGSVLHRAGSSAEYRVVGIVRSASSRTDTTAFVSSGTPIGPVDDEHTTWYLHTSHPVPWSAVRQLNSAGWAVLTRTAVLHPPPPAQWTEAPGQSSPDRYVALIVVAGMALLEVVLLAGPAFAVSARRRERDLAVVAAIGAGRRQLRRMVLAEGVVLGAVGGVLGVAGGLVLTAAGMPLLAAHVDRLPGGFDLRPVELLALAVVGLLTAVLAAICPARRAGRLEPVAALAGRRGQPRSRRAALVAGVLLVAAGLVLAGTAAAYGSGAYRILAGVALVEFGLIACTPSVLGWLAVVARRTPIPVRMALRDTARNRGSAASAVAAVMAAMVGAVALAVGLTTISADDQRTYQRSLPANVLWVALSRPSEAAGVEHALERVLPGAAAEEARGPAVNCFTRNCRDVNAAVRTHTGAAVPPPTTDGTLPITMVSDGTGLSPLLGALAGPAAAALRLGHPVVFTPQPPPAGPVRISVTTLGGDRPLHRHSAYSGAARVLRTAPDEPLPAVLLPPSVARHLQVPVERDGVVLRVATPLSTVAQQAVAAALYALDPVLMPSWDPGYRDRYAALSTAFLIGGAVLAVLAALIATALAAVDRRRDAQVLAAVGARPGMRRLMAMTQALVIAGVGTLIGAAAGFVAPTAYVLAENRLRASPGFVPMQVTAPWPTLAALLVLVPVVAAALAPLFGRARLPVERLP